MSIVETGVLRHSLGGAVIFSSLQHFIAPALDLMPRLQAEVQMVLVFVCVRLVFRSSL